jgi:hypothetical protein
VTKYLHVTTIKKQLCRDIRNYDDVFAAIVRPFVASFQCKYEMFFHLREFAFTGIGECNLRK